MNFDKLYEPLKETARLHFEHVQELLAHDRPDVLAKVTSVWRDPEEQLLLWRKGRTLVNGVWTKTGPVVTNAKPEQSAHCICLQDGTPSSMAWDISLFEGGKMCADNDPIWAVIAYSAACVGDWEELTCGAFFSTVRDWPHVERKNWKALVDEHGKVK